jgi:hypothetical protein
MGCVWVGGWYVACGGGGSKPPVPGPISALVVMMCSVLHAVLVVGSTIQGN